ncbi:hypothetical protein X566_04565 [Afipia sp. P52-10]|uniref:hypothetical protein n=1 Tax=Afipia sp. P52-10 TaxID=1429916 RepID=UPI0003DF2386|nr:hypothetical protein [Afipia sp. P52-10]ETR78969.1 hypothetical protein X566_04565 [Afipia sp. P52-10]
MDPTKEEMRWAADYAARVLRVFLDVHPTLSMQLIKTFEAVANEPGLTAQEYAQRLGTPSDVVTIRLADLSALNHHRKPGPALVASSIDIRDHRKKRHHLSLRGRLVLERLATVKPRKTQ